MAKRLAALAPLGAALALLGACASAERGDDERANGQPTFRSAGEGVTPERMTVTVEPFQDRNRDGWPDAIPVTVYIFAPSRSAQPLAFEGGFEFVLADLDGDPIADWRITPEQAPRALQRQNTLTGYRFGLGLPPPQGQEEFPQQTMLAARFLPEEGRPVAASVILPFGVD